MKKNLGFDWERCKGSLYVAAIVVANIALNGCASNRPSVDEAALVADGKKVNVRYLNCAATGDVVAVGDVGQLATEWVVMHSADWGATWQRASLEPDPSSMQLSLLGPPNNGDVNSIYLSGYSTPLDNVASAIVAGLTLSHLYRGYQPKIWWSTTDHGQTWHQVEPQLPLPPAELLQAHLPKVVVADETGTQVAAVDELGSSLAVLRSTNGGKTWEKQSLPKLDYVGSMFFPIDYLMVSDGHGRLAISGKSKSDSGAIYWSGDAGATWSESQFLFPEVPKSLGLYRSPSGAVIGFGQDMTGYNGPTVLIHSDDGGQTWVQAYRDDHLGPIGGIAGNNKGHVVAIAIVHSKRQSFGFVLISEDGGKSWRQATNHFGNLPFWLSFLGVNVIDLDNAHVIALIGAEIFRSSDGGETFQSVNSDLPDREFALWSYCTDGHGLIVVAGSQGMLTRSTDSGATWHRGKTLTTNSHSER